MFIFKVIHSFLVEITSYFKGNPKSFEPPILRTETLVPKSCTYKYSFFGNRNPFKTSLSLSMQEKKIKLIAPLVGDGENSIKALFEVVFVHF